MSRPVQFRDLFSPVRNVLRTHRGFLTDYQILGLLDPSLRRGCITRWGNPGLGGGRRPGAAAMIGRVCNQLAADPTEQVTKEYLSTSLARCTIDGVTVVPSHATLCAAFRYGR